MSELDELDDAISHTEDAISRAKEEVRVQTLQLSELKQLKNSRLPVNQLPPELLSEIFTQYRDSHITTGDAETSSFTLSWLAILLVSHHWRQTALNSPQLWTCIDLRSISAVHESIQRFGGLSLRIFMSPSTNTFPPIDQLLNAVRGYPIGPSSLSLAIDQFLNAVHSYLGGISTLSLNGTRTEILDCIPLMRCSAEHLRVLELSLPVGDNIGLPSDIWNMEFPNLEAVTLVRCDLGIWSCVRLISHILSLRRLCLNGCKPDGSSDLQQRGVVIRALFKTLESLPHLEVLMLVDCFRAAVDTTHSGPFEIPEFCLPSLKSLYVKDVLPVCAGISRCLKVSGACQTTMHALLAYRDRDMNSGLAPALFTLISSSPPQTLYFTLTDTGGLHIRSTSSQAPFDHSLRLHIDWNNEFALREIATRLSVHATRICLRIDNMLHREDSVALRTLCGGAQAIATAFRFEGPPAALAIVAECMADSPGFLPRLAEVSFNNFDIRAAASVDIETWAQALIKRQRKGVALGVDFGGCYGVLTELKDQLAKELDWVR